MFFDYNGVKVYYEETGEGKPLLLLHGWGCTHEIFSAFIPDFAIAHKVIALDFPGFGLSDEPDSVWGVQEYTRMLEAFCAWIGISRPSIVCHSFGGRVSILFASRNDVERMIFVDAAGIKPRRSLKYHLKLGAYKIGKWWLLKVCKDEERFRKMRASRGSADYNDASERMKAVLSRVVSQDLRDCLPKIKAPVLLFWGENDTATPLRDAVLMEKLIPDAGLVTVKGGGHFSFLEDPALFRLMIQRFLK